MGILDSMNAAAHQHALRTFDVRLRESEKFHMGSGAVHSTLRQLASDLRDAGIDYAVVGGMALNAHGYGRETVGVHLLVRRDGLERFVERCVGRGYLPVFEGARKSFRNTSTNTKVEFLTAGEYPGDGKPKPVAFPDPATVAIDIDGVRVVDLGTLITLKIASGITQPARRRDLADVQDLIRTLSLTESFGDTLDEYVRPMFAQLCRELAADDPHEEK